MSLLLGLIFYISIVTFFLFFGRFTKECDKALHEITEKKFSMMGKQSMENQSV
jgi:hypothetical protein